MGEKPYSIIDVETWKRKEYFEFYSTFDRPFFGIDTEIKCTNAVKYCKANGYSFFMYYMYQSFVAINEISEFKTRIFENEVRQYDTIHVGTTIGRKDESFGFAFTPFVLSFHDFCDGFKSEIDRVNDSKGLRFNKDTSRLDLIHCSSLPWISFKGLHHATNSSYLDSIPKLTFGKYYENLSEFKLPISVHGHHGLMDGIHVSQFLTKLELLLNTCE